MSRTDLSHLSKGRTPGGNTSSCAGKQRNWRVGSTNQRADETLIVEMQCFARGEVFDERAMPELDPEVVSFRATSESFAAVRQLNKKDLETLRCALEVSQ